MSYVQLHIILENNIVYETNSYKLSKINEQMYIKIKTGVQTCYSNGVKGLDDKFSKWMSIPYAKTQMIWFCETLQTRILQGIRKAENFITYKNV